MKSKPSISSLKEDRANALLAFKLVITRNESAHRDARDTHDAPLPAPLLESLSLVPEDGDALTGTDAFVAWVTGTSEGALRMLLDSDIHIAAAVNEGKDIEIERPFGFRETILPLRAGDTIVGALWSGKYRTRSLSHDAVNALAHSLDIDPAELTRHLEEAPIFSEAEATRHRTLLAQVRRGLEGAMAAQERYKDSASQLLESERIRSLGTLSGGVAHHFNNLLSVILGYSSFLLNRTELTPEADKALRQISEAAQKGRRLTEEILAFAGSEVEQETACSLHEILNSVLSLLETQTAGRVHVTTRLEAEKDTVRAPRSVLHQTVFNLLTNAIDSMPEGGDLAVTTSNTTVPIAGEQIQHIRIEVLDSGGVASEVATRRTQSAKKRKLTSLYGMVDRMEGTAVVSSDTGLSNRAEVVLPLDRMVVQVPEQRRVKRRLSPSLIWVVDDDPIFCEMCERVLSDDGHEARIIPSGGEMQRAWAETDKHPHLLIIDFSMPEYNGLELCTWLREQGSRAPVILVSGFSHTQPDIHKALKMRKTYFLQKPFPVPELADIVTVALGETLLGN